MFKIIDELRNHSFLLYYLTAKDFKLKYRRSVLGVAWSVLNPFFMMVILTVVFSKMFRFNVPNFPVYLILGQTLFNFFNEATTICLTSVLSNASLIKKVYIPKYVFPVEKVMFSFVNYVVSLVAVAAVIAYYVFMGKLTISWTVCILPVVLVLFFFFTMGVGLLVSTLAVFFRDTIHLYSIIITAWMYLTPIFYPFDALPAFLQKLVVFNPMHLFIDAVRNVVMWNSIPAIGSFAGITVASVLSMAIGCLVFFKNQNKFILHI